MPRTVDHDQRREEVGAVATELIARGGLEAATIRDLAQAGGYSTKVVTRYFADKRALLQYVYRAAAGRARARLDRARARRPDDLLACVDALLPLDDARRRDWAVWFAFWGIAVSDADFATEQRDRLRSTQRTLAAIARLAVDAGTLPAATDVEALARRLLTAIHGVAVQALFDRREWTPSRQRAAIAEQLPDSPASHS